MVSLVDVESFYSGTTEDSLYEINIYTSGGVLLSQERVELRAREKVDIDISSISQSKGHSGVGLFVIQKLNGTINGHYYTKYLNASNRIAGILHSHQVLKNDRALKYIQRRLLWRVTKSPRTVRRFALSMSEPSYWHNLTLLVYNNSTFTDEFRISIESINSPLVTAQYQQLTPRQCLEINLHELISKHPHPDTVSQSSLVISSKFGMTGSKPVFFSWSAGHLSSVNHG